MQYSAINFSDIAMFLEVLVKMHECIAGSSGRSAISYHCACASQLKTASGLNVSLIYIINLNQLQFTDDIL